MNSLVSVLMCVHNERFDYLKLAFESILNQDYNDIEIVIVDDCSCRTCSQSLNNLVESHANVVLCRNNVNIGLTKSLNIGLSLCRGEYIARMDADDYSHPSRIGKQVAFFEQHPEVDILGTGVISFGARNIFMSPALSMSDEAIKCELFFTSSLCHPSVMIRSEFLKLHGLSYDNSVRKGQDFDLWERASVEGKFAIISDVLLYYRIHEDQITSRYANDQKETAEKVMRRRLSRIGLDPSAEEMKCHLALKGLCGCDVDDAECWMKRVLQANERIRLVSQRALESNLTKRMVVLKLKLHRPLSSVGELTSLMNLIGERCVAKFRLRHVIRKRNSIFSAIGVKV